MRVGYFAGVDYTLMKFDLSCIADCGNITSIQLRLSFQSGTGNGKDVIINRMITDWEPATATYNRPKGGSTVWAGGSNMTSADWTTTGESTTSGVNQPTVYPYDLYFDVTNIVNDWIGGSNNYGLVVRFPASETTHYWDWVQNGAGDSNKYPRLIVVCTPGTATPSIQLTKTITKTVTTIGDTITYCINYQNNASYTIGSLVIWDSIPAVTDFITADSGYNTTNGSPNVVYWTVSSLTATASGSKCFSVRVARYPYNIFEQQYRLGLITKEEYDFYRDEMAEAEKREMHNAVRNIAHPVYVMGI